MTTAATIEAAVEQQDTQQQTTKPTWADCVKLFDTIRDLDVDAAIASTSTTIGDLYDDLKMAVSGAVNIVHTEGDVPRALELAKAVAPPRSSNCKTSEDDAPSPLNDGSAPFKATPQVGMRVTAVDYDGTWLNGVIVSQTLHGAFVQTECGKLYGAEWKDVQLLCEFTDEAVATF